MTRIDTGFRRCRCERCGHKESVKREEIDWVVVCPHCGNVAKRVVIGDAADEWTRWGGGPAYRGTVSIPDFGKMGNGGEVPAPWVAYVMRVLGVLAATIGLMAGMALEDGWTVLVGVAIGVACMVVAQIMFSIHSIAVDTRAMREAAEKDGKTREAEQKSGKGA